MTDVPTLTKRVYDERLFSVDVSGKLRSGDTVTAFDSVIASAFSGGGENPTDLSVAVASAPITEDKVLNFTCSDGQAGVTYTVALRYVSDSETQLESIVRVKVI